MTDSPAKWLEQQKQQQRQILLIIDTSAAPEVVASLFEQGPVRDYIKVFQQTEFEQLVAQSPWLVRIDSSSMPVLLRLLQTPQCNWGWVAGVPQLDLNEMAQHWRERMLVSEDGQRSFYRFQDNRVIARHLAALAPHHVSLLLGPAASALCWDGEQWQCVENSAPGRYPAPFVTPWLDLPEPRMAIAAIEIRAVENWLWEHHPRQTFALEAPLKRWIKEQLDLATKFEWNDAEQIFFLIEYKLDPDFSHHPVWMARAWESPEQHFCRARIDLMALKAGTYRSPHRPMP